MEAPAGMEWAGAHSYYPGIEREAAAPADLVAVNQHLPCDLTAFIRALRSSVYPARILVTFDFLQPDRIGPALLAGAAGCIDRNATPERFFQVVGECLQGAAVIPFPVADWLSSSRWIQMADDATRRIFGLLAGGHPMREVVARTGLSDQDIRNRVFRALNR
jgi:DNA-binding NarL/FixJ family response regulator